MAADRLRVRTTRRTTGRGSPAWLPVLALPRPTPPAPGARVHPPRIGAVAAAGSHAGLPLPVHPADLLPRLQPARIGFVRARCGEMPGIAPPPSAKADIAWFQRRIHSLWKAGALEGGL